jgi:8-oxo-dGTP diphosphatase
MQPIGGDGFTPIDEVDEVRWVTIDEARDVLTYGHDVSVLDSFVASLASGGD